MFMSNLRRAAKKQRGLMMVVIGILCFGLLSSVVLIGLNNAPQTVKGKISSLERDVNKAKNAVSKKPNDYTANLKAADLLFELAYWYNYDNVNPRQTYAEAAEYYGAAINNVSDTVSEKSKAILYTNRATALYFSGDSQNADLIYRFALALAPDDWDTNEIYTWFLQNEKGAAKALEHMQQYRDSLRDGDPNISKADALIDELKPLV